MPHLFVEYTDNLDGFPEVPVLTALNATVIASGEVLDECDLKSRVTRTTRFAVGNDATASRGFVHAELRLLTGRTPEAKRDLSERIAAVLREHTPKPEGMLVQLSVDVVDMDRAAYFKGRL
ncbi:5-carboxymethyl-2-hydroxymuconate isomerase [Comamonas serinivorans]|uniref:5-carboxymethyl-2-hydroxymuconate isomerase n=1 Tax=Comamonas serinivorans TaxID=1082851 RepID=A0A1Y0EQV7_9BURK|nr:5-carboxymethyl-2-hydroxymuconate Delta-isomerase [Comamonas serinivorans]ARU05810.1 5-carboxymethyl-2-hydroxymuconate isomerase [Comamonas serinivorans]